MGLLTVTLLGAVAGFTILIGLPVARLRVLSRGAQGFLNALATGVLLFLLWDILSKASQPVEAALGQARVGSANSFVGLAAIFAGGIAIGLLSLSST